MPWNPEQYEKFKAQRKEPFYDLLKLIRVKPKLKVIDLGCGTGELTRELADFLPDSEVLGIDSSAEMLSKAAPFARDNLHFQQMNIEDAAGEYDLVFSHAAIQWVDHHETLIPRLFGLLRAGGQLVIQQPANFGNVTHTSIYETAASEPFKSALGAWARAVSVQKAEKYGEWLFALGASEIHLVEKIYPHIMPDAEAVLEWIKGTALLPYIERLPADLHPEFQAAILAKLQAYYGTGALFLGFRRMLMSASREAR